MRALVVDPGKIASGVDVERSWLRRRADGDIHVVYISRVADRNIYGLRGDAALRRRERECHSGQEEEEEDKHGYPVLRLLLVSL